uniref:SNF2_N domain-containing protein n=1 Tax=Gongylonema pulchrum TaxID=637853 RepID=A0A183EUB5_9BILA
LKHQAKKYGDLKEFKMRDDNTCPNLVKSLRPQLLPEMYEWLLLIKVLVLELPLSASAPVEKSSDNLTFADERDKVANSAFSMPKIVSSADFCTSSFNDKQIVAPRLTLKA